MTTGSIGAKTGRTYPLTEAEAKELARKRNNRARRMARRIFEETMRDGGMTKVRGSVSGRTYWE